MFRRSIVSLRQQASRRNFSSDHGHDKVKYEGLEVCFLDPPFGS